jgi:NDP-sugar pyrophosphorylase family protein
MSARTKPGTAAILCGGKGTRLQSLLPSTPKFLAPIGDKKFADYMLGYLLRQGISKVVLCTGYQAAQIEQYCSDGSRWNLEIVYSNEAEPLGTGGALKNAEHLIASDSFVINGDSLLDVDLQTLWDFHTTNKARVTMALTEVEDSSRFGSVSIGGDGKVNSFVEKGSGGHGFINAGYYVVSQCILSFVPIDMPVSLESVVLPRLIGNGLYGIPMRSSFIDIGTPDSLADSYAAMRSWGKKRYR